MQRIRIALLSLAYALFVFSFFLPAAESEYSKQPIRGLEAARYTFGAAVGDAKSEFEQVLRGRPPSDILFDLVLFLMLSGNLYMVVAWLVVLRPNRRLLLAALLANIIVIGGALLPVLMPDILPELTVKNLLIGYYAWALSFVVMLIVTFVPTQKESISRLKSGASPEPSAMAIAFAFALVASPTMAQEFNEIYYLCADWGPAMALPTKKGERPQFSDTEEEVYFLKQLTTFKRQRLSTPDPFTGRKEQEVWSRRSIYLCKMKPDGTEKMEIKELWRDPNYPIDVQGQSTWLDVNEKTHTVALAIAYAGSDMTGLWTMGLDGSGLKRIITPENTEKHLQAINKPSWTPDGQWIVFEEELRGMNPNQYRLAKCDKDGKSRFRLTDGPQDRQPSVSPDGSSIVYVHDPRIKLGKDGFGTHWVAATLWLIDLDGSSKHEISNPEAKPTWPAKGISGTWPAWSPDGGRIYFIGTAATICDAATGRVLWERTSDAHRPSWSLWGKGGLVGSCVGGIVASDPKTMKTSVLAASHQSECTKDNAEESRW